MHSLDITFFDNLNPKAFKVEDLSIYTDNINIKNAVLEIAPPGFSKAIPFFVKKGFSIIFNSTLLKLNSLPEKNTPSLPDGLYILKYSISPNKVLNVEYNYFRTVALERKWLNSLIKLKNSKSNYSREEFKNKFNGLMGLKQFINGAKYMVEDNHDFCKGNEMYKEVESSLDNFKFCIKC